MKGIIRWYNNLKGFGFIVDENGEDVVIRRSLLPAGATLFEGEKVEFEIEDTPKGSQITHIKKM